jgi:hypothetical protein
MLILLYQSKDIPMMHKHIGRENALIPLCVSDLQAFDDEPRVRDIRLGEVLGFERNYKIRELIERNIQEVESFGSCPRRGGMIEAGKGAKREVQEYWLNEEQAHLICIFAKTAKAAEVRRQMIKVFVAWRHGRLEAPKKHVFSGELTFSQRIACASSIAGAVANRIGDPDNQQVFDEALEWAFKRLGPIAPPKPVVLTRQASAPAFAKTVERWWRQCLDAGTIGDSWPDTIACGDLFAHFQAFGELRDKPSHSQRTSFGAALKRLVPGLDKARGSGRDGRSWIYMMPTLESCRRAIVGVSRGAGETGLEG